MSGWPSIDKGVYKYQLWNMASNILFLHQVLTISGITRAGIIRHDGDKRKRMWIRRRNQIRVISQTKSHKVEILPSGQFQMTTYFNASIPNNPRNFQRNPGSGKNYQKPDPNRPLTKKEIRNAAKKAVRKKKKINERYPQK